MTEAIAPESTTSSVKISPEKIKSIAQEVISNEAQAIHKLVNTINDQFFKAIEVLLHCRGRIILIGMGKSGHIARKIAATLASTGSPAQFVHAGEAAHGDMGMITQKDVAIALSNSGNTKEILELLPPLKRLAVPIISLCCNPKSSLATAADFNLHVAIDKEACPLNLAPTTSTTAMLALGDIIAITLLEAKQFSRSDFALSHPAGSLGRKLLLTVEHIMHKDLAIPKVTADVSLKEALIEMTSKRLGVTTIVDHQNKLQGIFTDGDLRRTLEKHSNVDHVKIGDVMTLQFKGTQKDMLAAEALVLMQANKITSLPVVDQTNALVGLVHLHDIFKAGII